MKEKKIYLKPTIKTLEIDVSCCLLAGSGASVETHNTTDTDGGDEFENDAKVSFHFLDSDGSW